MLVRKLSRDCVAGYLAAEPVRGDRDLELLDLGGKVIRIPLAEVKWVCFLRELPDVPDAANPERLLHKRFRNRPRSPGLWVRLELADHDVLEGIVANDSSLVRGAGLLLTPPDTRSNTQRIFVPVEAIQSMEVVARLVGARPRAEARDDQPHLFAAE